MLELDAVAVHHRQARLHVLIHGTALDIDGVGHELPGQGQPQGLDHLGAGLFLRLVGAGSQVRRGHHVREVKQRVAGGRLGHEHVDASAGHPAVLERHAQGVLVHDAAPGRVDDAHTRLDQVQFTLPDQPDGLRRLRQVHADEIGLGQQVVEVHQAHAELRRTCLGDVRVVGDDLHAEARQPLRDQDPNPAEPEDAGHLAADLDPGELRPLPLAGLERGHRLRHVPGDREEQRGRVLGGAHDVGAWRVHHHHARLGGSGHVDVVQADPRPGDDAQARGMRERLLVHLRGAPDDDCVHTGQRCQQLGAVRAIGVAHLEVRLEQRDGGG